MSHLQKNDESTQLMPVLFADGSDRRTSARIPLSGTVRMGPPGGEPYATVSARDLSRNGLFIDADRAVKVGARFSAEINLANGEKIYVPQAEVAYNREHPHGSGFGVRFVEMPSEVETAIEDELRRVRRSIVHPAVAPSLPPVSQFEVLDTKSEPPEENATEILPHDTMPPLPREPMIAGDAFDDIESELPEERPGILEEAMRVGHDLKARVIERSRRFPVLWTSLAITGSALVVSAIGLALWSGSNAEAVEPVAIEDRGVSATTHQALMDNRTMPDVVEAPPQKQEVEVVEPKKPLPPLVVLEEKRPEPQLVVEEKVEKKAIEKKKKVEAPKKVAAPREVKTALTLDPKARVLKTHVLRSPDRFVVDVVGQDKAPVFPAASGAVRSIRFGRHPEYTRIVIETNAPIASGRAGKNGKVLTVALEMAR